MLSISIIIPCRNEKGNIEAAITRCPEFGLSQEFIFVEGHSQDGTLDEIKRVKEKYPHKNIRYLTQDGAGKGDAVRKGFAHATGDILMILDADLTVQPEELPDFYQAIKKHDALFVNGSRLVQRMESKAMRFLNYIANHFFAQLLSWLIGQRITDALCGTKVLYKKDYEKIAAARTHFGEFDPFGDFDLLFGASRLGLKIVEVPVNYKARTYGTTQIRRFKHGFMLLKMCWVGFKKLKLPALAYK